MADGVRSLLAFWAGGGGEPQSDDASVGRHAMLAFWMGGAGDIPGPSDPDAGTRSFLAGWMGGAGDDTNIVVVPPVTPPVPDDENGVQGSGGGPPKPHRRPILHLHGYKPQVVDPQEYFRPKPKAAKVERVERTERRRVERVERIPDLPAVGRMPDDLAARLEAAITAIETKRALAELAAAEKIRKAEIAALNQDDEEAIIAILLAAMR